MIPYPFFIHSSFAGIFHPNYKIQVNVSSGFRIEAASKSSIDLSRRTRPQHSNEQLPQIHSTGSIKDGEANSCLTSLTPWLAFYFRRPPTCPSLACPVSLFSYCCLPRQPTQRPQTRPLPVSLTLALRPRADAVPPLTWRPWSQMDSSGRWRFAESHTAPAQRGVCKMKSCECPSGWRLWDRRCYRAVSRRLSWTEARQHCRRLDPTADLVSIINQRENDFTFSE